MQELSEVIELVTKRGCKIEFEYETQPFDGVKITVSKDTRKISWLLPWLLIKQSNFDIMSYEIAKNSEIISNIGK